MDRSVESVVYNVTNNITKNTTNDSADGTLYSVLYQFMLACTIIGGFVIGYELLRQTKIGKYIYAPRLILLPDQTPEVANGWFGWFNKNKKIDEDYILRNNGLDAVMVLKLYRMAYQTFAIIAVFVLVFTLPINVFFRNRDMKESISQKNSTTLLHVGHDNDQKPEPEPEPTQTVVMNDTVGNVTAFGINDNTTININNNNSLAIKLIEMIFEKRDLQVDIKDLNINEEEERNEFFNEELKILNDIKLGKYQVENNNTEPIDTNNNIEPIDTNNNTEPTNTTNIDAINNDNSTSTDREIDHSNSTIPEVVIDEIKNFDIRQYIFFDTMKEGKEGFSLFHVVAVYFVIGVICYKLFRVYQEYLISMEKYVKDGGIVQERNMFGEILQHSTIMVRNIPPELQDDQRLMNWFSKLGIGKIESVVIARSRNKIRNLIIERTKVLNDLENEYVAWINNIKAKKSGESILGSLLKSVIEDTTDDIGEKEFEDNDAFRPKMVVFKYKVIPEKYVDSIHYLEKRLLDLTDQIKELRLEAAESKKWSQTAFITFSNHQSAKIASQLILYSSAKPNVMAASSAPHPNDLLYKNLNIRTESKTYRSLIIYVAMYFTCFVLFIIVSATKFGTLENVIISSLDRTGMQTLHDTVKARFDKIDNSPKLSALFNNFFQVILLNTFISCVPYILKFLSNFQGFETKSAYSNSILKKYYIFLFINIIMAMSVSTLVGEIFDEKNSNVNTKKALTMWESLSKQWMELNFNQFVSSLTVEFAKNSVMYFNYGILRLQSFGFEIFRIGSVISFFISRLLKKESPREQHLAKVMSAPPDYSIILAVPLLCLTIFITFSIVNPFMPIIGVIFFYVGYHIMKNQFIYVYVKDYESQGHYFITAFNRIIFSLFLFEIFMFGYFLCVFKTDNESVKGNIETMGVLDQKIKKDINKLSFIPYLILPSILITYYFYNYCRKCFKPKIDNVPVDLLISKERERKYTNHFQRRTIFGRTESFVSDYYSEDSFMSCATHITGLDNKPNKEILKLSEEEAPDLPPYYEAKSYSNPALTEPLYSPWISEEAQAILTENTIDNIVDICKFCHKCDNESRFD